MSSHETMTTGNDSFWLEQVIFFSNSTAYNVCHSKDEQFLPFRVCICLLVVQSICITWLNNSWPHKSLTMCTVHNSVVCKLCYNALFQSFSQVKKKKSKLTKTQPTNPQTTKKPAKLCSPNTVLVTFLSSFPCMFVQLTAQNIWMLRSTPAKSNRRMTIHQNQPDNRKHIPIPELLLSDSKWQGMKQKEHRAWFATEKLSPKNDKKKNLF